MAPGDDVKLILRSTLGGEPYDIDLGSADISVSLYNPFDFSGEELDIVLDFVRTSPGIYEAVLTIPDNLTSYGEIWVDVDYDDGEYWEYASYSIMTGPYSVWGVSVSRDSSSFVFDVYVYDGDGRPLQGAEVTAREWWYEVEDSGVTDENGSVRLTLEEDYSEETDLDIDIRVNYGGVVQYCEIEFLFPEDVDMEMPEPPVGEGLEVWIENLEPLPYLSEEGLIYISPPGNVVLQARAYYGGYYYTGEIVWYTYDGENAISGSAVTGSEGAFQISINLVEGRVYPIIFRAPGDGTNWTTTDFPLFIYASPSTGNAFNMTVEDLMSDEIEISHGPLYSGYPLTVEYRYTGTEEYSGEMSTIFNVLPGELNLSTPVLYALEGGFMGEVVPGSLGPIHVERVSLDSPVTTITATFPKLPEEVAGDTITLVCGYVLVERVYEVLESEFMESMMYLYTHLQDFIKVSYVTLTWEEPQGTIRGMVQNETGSPIENATVTVDGTTVSTGPDGLYEVTVTPGERTVRVEKEGYIPGERVLEVPLAGTVYANFTLRMLPEEGWGHLQVTVKNGTGAPLEGATVTVTGLGQSATTDEEGKALFEYLPLGTYTVEVVKEGYRTGSAEASLRENTTTELTITLERLPEFPWCILKVTVKDYYSDEPVEGATVTVTGEDVNHSATATTDENGECVFAYIPAGHYRVRVEKEGYVTNETAVTPAVNDTTGITVVFRPTAPPPVSGIYGGGFEKRDGKYRFEVYYNDTGGRPPQAVYVVIDGERYNMTGEGDDYRGGVKYTFEIELEEGEHSYYFEVIGPDGEPVEPMDDTPGPGSAATFKVKEEAGGISPVLLAIILLVILVIIVVVAFALKGKKGIEEEE